MPSPAEAEINDAQQKGGSAIVEIGAVEGPKAIAKDLIEKLYAYDLGTALFKPTKAAADPFRGDPMEALSCFATGIVPENGGFALASYTKVPFKNEDVIVDSDSALTMDNHCLTTTGADEARVEYTLGHVRDPSEDQAVSLVSSLPSVGRAMVRPFLNRSQDRVRGRRRYRRPGRIKKSKGGRKLHQARRQKSRFHDSEWFAK